MTIATTVLITGSGLALYYLGMIIYDLYIEKLKLENSDDNQEEAVDISDQVQDFQAIPVNKTDEQNSKKKRFENLLRAGISAEKANRMMVSLASGNPAKELEDVMYIIHEHQTSTINQ